MSGGKKNWNQDKIKFYKYFFKGIEKPIVMEALNKAMADEMLSLLPQKTNVPIDMSLLEDIKIEVPVTGISKRQRLGKSYIWVGTDRSDDGWMLEDDFNELVS